MFESTKTLFITETQTRNAEQSFNTKNRFTAINESQKENNLFFNAIMLSMGTLIFVACKNSKEARKIAKALLHKRLAACANIIPKVESHYRWKGKIENAGEALLILKTRKKLRAKVEKEIKKLHSYELPAIEFIEAKAGKEIEKWIGTETKK